MKTTAQKKSGFRERAPSHPEQAKNTHAERLYEVTLFWTKYSSGSVKMPASSEQEAKRRASALGKYLTIEWREYADEMKVQRVTLLKEGGRQ